MIKICQVWLQTHNFLIWFEGRYQFCIILVVLTLVCCCRRPRLLHIILAHLTLFSLHLSIMGHHYCKHELRYCFGSTTLLFIWQWMLQSCHLFWMMPLLLWNFSYALLVVDLPAVPQFLPRLLYNQNVCSIYDISYFNLLHLLYPIYNQYYFIF